MYNTLLKSRQGCHDEHNDFENTMKLYDKNYSEDDTRAKFIDPAIRAAGWAEDRNISRNVPLGEGEVIPQPDGGFKRLTPLRADYILSECGIPLVVCEAKASHKPATDGLGQAKKYAKRFHVPFAVATNGNSLLVSDFIKSKHFPFEIKELEGNFPNRDEIKNIYEEYVGCSLKELAGITDDGEGLDTPRYHQEAAVRAGREAIALANKKNKPVRILFNMATGSGKTIMLVNFIKKLYDEGKIKKGALILSDMTTLNKQLFDKFKPVFKRDVAMVKKGNHSSNAKIQLAMFQTLDRSAKEYIAHCLLENRFDCVVEDECHRSGWNKWSSIWKLNPNAMHIGLTATPRNITKREDVLEEDDEVKKDYDITNCNRQYFGEPAYTYTATQGVEDGYLAPLKAIHPAEISTDAKGLSVDEIMELQPVDFTTWKPLTRAEVKGIKKVFTVSDFEKKIVLLNRIEKQARHFFKKLVEKNGVCEKTIVFCQSDKHAVLLSEMLTNRYAEHCNGRDIKPVENYAFPCTSLHDGNKTADYFKKYDDDYFIATTVQLLSTGVDIPNLRNVVFVKTVNSPISYGQMSGRGKRLATSKGKYFYEIYDYTNATRHLNTSDEWQAPNQTGAKNGNYENSDKLNQTAYVGKGLDVKIIDGEICFSYGQKFINYDEYKSIIKEYVQPIHNIDTLRKVWIDKNKRQSLLNDLPCGEYRLEMFVEYLKMKDYDIFDILAKTVFGMHPKTQKERVEMFENNNEEWFNTLPIGAVDVIKALVRQFGDAPGGISELENLRDTFNAAPVKNAGGVDMLEAVPGKEVSEILTEIKERLFV